MSEKISAAKAAQVYSEIPGVLRALAGERDNLRVKLAAANRELEEYKRNGRIEKIAHVMEDKGLDLGSSFNDKVEKIKEAHASGRSLDVIEEAVNMTARQGGLGKLGSDTEVGNGASDFEAYLLGGLE